MHPPPAATAAPALRQRWAGWRGIVAVPPIALVPAAVAGAETLRSVWQFKAGDAAGMAILGLVSRPPMPRVLARVHRRRAVAAALALLVVALAAAWFATRPDGGTAIGKKALPPAQTAAAPRGLPAAESGLLPWHMAQPISREVVVTGSPGQLVVLGGLMASGASANGVYAVSTASGAARRIGTLSAPVHDAAAAVSGRQALIFGGGSPATVPTVQAFAPGGTPAARQGGIASRAAL